eukprot:3286154-Rhodomonas_salina.1
MGLGPASFSDGDVGENAVRLRDRTGEEVQGSIFPTSARLKRNAMCGTDADCATVRTRPRCCHR